MDRPAGQPPECVSCRSPYPLTPLHHVLMNIPHAVQWSYNPSSSPAAPSSTPSPQSTCTCCCATTRPAWQCGFPPSSSSSTSPPSSSLSPPAFLPPLAYPGAYDARNAMWERKGDRRRESVRARGKRWWCCSGLVWWGMRCMGRWRGRCIGC